ncbi:MAG: T9SS type A sorting domain-containing protein, partial [Bacteroidales bacterium]|nr:T9SS type A sorting domain-containing protein [Bacteroidales bacterium]
VDGGGFELKAPQYGVPYFIDPAEDLVIGSFYCYKVNAIWESETDQCESEFSNETCVLWTGTAEFPETVPGKINLYPNPASDQVFITSVDPLMRISVFMADGQMIYGEEVSTTEIRLNTSGYPAGVYLVRVEAVYGISTHLLTIQR